MTRRFYKQICLVITLCLMLASVSPAVLTVYAEEVLTPKAEVTYYISSSEGDDTNDGLTEQTPWRTLDKVNSMAFQPGTHILFKKGDQWNGDLYINNSGEQGKMITYSAYGSGEERPVINGTGVPNRDESGNLLWKSGSAAILVKDAEYIRIEGLGVTNMGVDKEGNPNLVQDLANGKNEKLRSGIAVVQGREQQDKVLNKIEIVDNEIYHVKGVSLRELHESEDKSEDGNMYNNAGIYFFIEGANNLGITRIDDLLIENNYIHDTSCMGIHTQPENGGGGYNSRPSSYNTNVRILNNQIARTGADAIIVGYTDKVLVEGNVAYDAGKKSTGNRVRVIAGIWPYNSSDSVFQYNEVARTHFDRGDGMAWDSDWGTSGDLIYQYNYSHENEGGTLMDCNTTDVHNWIHRYNLSVNEPGVQWTITAHEVGKIEFYNNTVYIAQGGGRLKIYAPRVSDIRMYNNIFVADTADYNEFRATGNAFVNNIVSGHEGPYFGKNTIIDDPQFVDVTAAEVEKTLNNIVYLKTPGALDGWDKIQGWQLQSTSPAINRGLVVDTQKVPEALKATKDIAGSPVTGTGFDGKVDIGAFEFQGEYTGNGEVNIAPMAASHGVEVEFATTMSEGIVSRNIDGVNYELTHIKNGDTLTFDKVNLDRNAGIMTLKANVLEKTTIEVTIGNQVVGEVVLETGNGEYKLRFNEEIPSGEYPVQLTFKGESANELIRLDQFKLLPGRQGVVSVPYKYTFEDGVEGWHAVGGSGQVTTQNGQLKLASADIYTSTIAPEVTNGIVEAEITAGPNQRSTLIFRYDELTGKYMEIGFDVGNYWFISSEGLGITQEQINSPNCPTVESGKTYTVKIKYEGNHIQVFIDGSQVLNKTFTGSTPSSGTVGMRKWQNSSAYTTLVDNIRINAGKISGQVTLTDTKEPVAGATVSLEGTTHQTTTNANGEYVFDTVALDKAYTVWVEGESIVTPMLTIANDEVTVDTELAVTPSEMQKVTLSGVDTIDEHKNFTLQVGVEGTKNTAYAQEILIQYNPEKVTFDSVKKLGNTELAGFKDDATLGQVKILMATPNGIENTGTLCEIVFSSKSVEKDESATFTATGQLGVVEEHTGSIVELEGATHTLQIKDVPVEEIDKAELRAAIERAEAIYAQAEEGIRPGQYPEGSKNQLKAAINTAKQVADTATSQDGINQAVEALNQAIKTFLESVHAGMIEDVNKDNQVDIADIALVAYYYTAKADDANWESAQVADINDDKEVNIHDLTLVAQKILSE